MTYKTTLDAISNLGPDFQHAAQHCAETLRHIDEARKTRILFLRRCVTENTDRLIKLKEEIGTLPEQIAKWDAEAERLESQTAEDLLRQALGAVILHPQPPGEVIEALLTKPAPEPYRAGLPPERLRKVWAEWEMVDGVVYVFQGNKYRCAYRPTTEWWDIGAEHTWRASYRPHGKSWSEVEAMADAAEKPAEPKMLDLTKLPPGTVCEAVGEIAVPCVFLKLKVGRRFSVVEVMQPPTAEGEDVRVLIGDDTWALPALVPARVVKEGGEQ